MERRDIMLGAHGASRRPFHDREAAGRELARKVRRAVGSDGGVAVFGLPRSGVPVAASVAEELAAALDVVLVRKLTVPDRVDLGMGALGEGGVRVLTREILDAAQVSAEAITAAERRERAELQRQAACYRRGAPPANVRDYVCVVVDDAIVTGGTMRAAVRVLRALGARRIVLAAPVGAAPALAALQAEGDDVVVVARPGEIRSVATWYRCFPPVSDDEVVGLLSAARTRVSARSSALPSPP